MKYSEFLNILQSKAEPNFADFQRKLIFTKYKILGVRTPTLRKLAKEFQENLEEVFHYPNEYYEVVFIKLTMVSMLPYENFLAYLDDSVSLIDNWALCDSFKAKCIKKRVEEFLPVLDKIFQNGGVYHVRYVLVTLLSFYCDGKYLTELSGYIVKADTSKYYVHMAVAWLTAELLIKQYEYGVILLKNRCFDKKTHNKAIQKAVESYRLSTSQKEYLRTLKIK